MKTAIKLVLIYFLMQVLGMLTVIPFALLYVYVSAGALDGDSANRIALAPRCWQAWLICSGTCGARAG